MKACAKTGSRHPHFRSHVCSSRRADLVVAGMQLTRLVLRSCRRQVDALQAAYGCFVDDIRALCVRAKPATGLNHPKSDLNSAPNTQKNTQKNTQNHRWSKADAAWTWLEADSVAMLVFDFVAVGLIADFAGDATVIGMQFLAPPLPEFLLACPGPVANPEVAAAVAQVMTRYNRSRGYFLLGATRDVAMASRMVKHMVRLMQAPQTPVRVCLNWITGLARAAEGIDSSKHSTTELCDPANPQKSLWDETTAELLRLYRSEKADQRLACCATLKVRRL